MHGGDGDYHNPFDKGWRRNCLETCKPMAAPAAPFVLRRAPPLGAGRHADAPLAGSRRCTSALPASACLSHWRCCVLLPCCRRGDGAGETSSLLQMEEGRS